MGVVFDNFGGSTYNWAMLAKMDDFIKSGSKEDMLLQKIDPSRIPRHIAVIMDGNGRWAKKRNLPRIEGHRAGAKSVQEIVETCARLGIKYLTLFAFSKENWKRPRREVSTLWKLLEEYLKNEDKVLLKNNFRLMTIGQSNGLPAAARKQLDRVIELTRDNDGLTLILALNYGGRAEIVDTVKKIATDSSIDINNLNEDIFSRMLYTTAVPDPDLLIRTSGELRVSNFLLWQIAYSEIWVTTELWPDFRKLNLIQAVLDYQSRERRFGDISPKSRSG